MASPPPIPSISGYFITTTMLPFAASLQTYSPISLTLIMRLESKWRRLEVFPASFSGHGKSFGFRSNPRGRICKLRGRIESTKCVDPELSVKYKSDFVDDEWKDRPSVKLYRLSDRDVCKLGRVVLQKLGSGVSPSDVGALFLLAFQLRKEGCGVKDFVFPEMDPLSSVNDVGYESLDKEITSVIVRTPAPLPIEGSSESENARGYAFLAASVMKLFRRTPENFLRGWSQIQNRYTDFYGEPCPIRNVRPHLLVVRNIHQRINYDLSKVTLYRILYMSNESSHMGGMKRFLYENDLAYTGMHIVPIFIELCKQLNCSSSTLLSLLEGNSHKEQVNLLWKVSQLMDDKTEQHKRGMWRYGRIFDQKFMTPLQTRLCQNLVVMLGCMLQHVSPRSSGNVLSIKQLDINADFREMCINRAEEFVNLVRDTEAKTNSQWNRTA